MRQLTNAIIAIIEKELNTKGYTTINRNNNRNNHRNNRNTPKITLTKPNTTGEYLIIKCPTPTVLTYNTITEPNHGYVSILKTKTITIEPENQETIQKAITEITTC